MGIELRSQYFNVENIPSPKILEYLADKNMLDNSLPQT